MLQRAQPNDRDVREMAENGWEANYRVEAEYEWEASKKAEAKKGVGGPPNDLYFPLFLSRSFTLFLRGGLKNKLVN